MTAWQTTEERVAALESLLPLLEAHFDTQRLVPRAQWESQYEPPPPGWTPPPPEPDCGGACPSCGTFLAGQPCGMREEWWARQWIILRNAYPQLWFLEDPRRGLLVQLMYEHANWASALYWHHIQPWDGYERNRRKEWAKAAVEWLAEKWEKMGLGYLPTYVPPGMPHEDPLDAQHRLIVALRVQKGLSYRSIGKIVGRDKNYVGKVLHALDVR